MNSSELAEKMLLWEKSKRALDALGAEIEAEVLHLEKTQVVGSVRVTYSGGRATYDYQAPSASAPKEIIQKYTTEKLETDWKQACEIAKVDQDIIDECTHTMKITDYASICKEAKIEPMVISKTPATAKIKLEE
jgi:hypothetical protein